MDSAQENRIVPWMSMAEWRKVYKFAYSQDYEDQWQSLSRMLLWKTRVSKLTLGVECTLYLLQAVLRDKEFKENSTCVFLENDVRLVYSTAIIRFVNLISHLGQVELKHQPITAVAEKVGIPDWLVGIRHEATHAKMPSLAILRPGAELALKWLEENYWRTEEEDSYDLYWPTSSKLVGALNGESKDSSYPQRYTEAPVNPKLVEIVSFLLSLLRKMPHSPTLGSIKPALHDYICSLGKKCSKKTKSAQVYNLILEDLERITSEIVNACSPVGGDDKLNELKGRHLVTALFNCQEFLNFDTTFTQLLPLYKLVHQWRNLPHLIEKLIDRSLAHSDQTTAVLQLLADICCGLLDARKSDDLTFNKTSLESFDWTESIKRLLKEPNPATWSVVSKMCQLQEMPAESQDKLEQLLQLYLGCATLKDDHPPQKRSKIFSVEMLYAFKAGRPIQEPVQQNLLSADTASSKPPDSWTLSLGYDWSRTPIGHVPGKELDEVKPLDDADWNLVDPDPRRRDYDAAAERTAEKFDWNSLVRKRRRRGGLTKDNQLDI